MIPLKKLIVSQDGLRNTAQLDKMVEFVKRGGKFTRDAMLLYHVMMGRDDSPVPIHIAEVMGEFYIHDGHHRAIAKWIGGANAIYEDEYEIVSYSLDDYVTPSVKRGWHTPFDPRTEFRLADLNKYRQFVNEMIKEGYPIEDCAWFDNLYKTNRRFATLEEMIKEIDCVITIGSIRQLEE